MRAQAAIHLFDKLVSGQIGRAFSIMAMRLYTAISASQKLTPMLAGSQINRNGEPVMPMCVLWKDMDAARPAEDEL